MARSSPTTAGTYNFNVTVRGAGAFSSCASSRSYSLAVNCAPLTLTQSLANGVQGTAYNQTVAASPAGGNYSYTVVTNVLPPGLSLTLLGRETVSMP